MIIVIAAVAENNAIGRNNDLLWHLPNDFKRFRNLTTGHHIIMGRKTFESLPKLLPNRTHIIITRQKKYAFKSCIVVSNLKEALTKIPHNEDVYVIGGGEIYAQSLQIADKIEITKVHHNFEADTFFPEISPEEWELIFEENHPADERHSYAYTFQTFIKKHPDKNRDVKI